MNKVLDEEKWKRRLRSGEISRPDRFAVFALQKVSRTFALNILVLPSRLRNQVLLSYLFCRMADTIEDDKSLSPETKNNLLLKFSSLFPACETWYDEVSEFRSLLPPDWENSSQWDRLITFHCLWIFGLYHKLSRQVKPLIAKWVIEMCGGMAEFSLKQKDRLNGEFSLETMEELNRYCYYVAGTVGNMLCDLFSKNSILISLARKKKLEVYSVSFGLGLQLTNILKDVSEDMERKVLFLPRSLLENFDLTKDSVFLPENHVQTARMTGELIKKASKHLDDAVEYTCLLPRLEPRLRLFCLWPLFMAAETLVLIARSGSIITAEKKIKITRSQVKNIIKRTSVICWSNTLIRKFYKKINLELEDALNHRR